MSSTGIFVNLLLDGGSSLVFDVFSDGQASTGVRTLNINWTAGGIASLEAGNWALNAPVVAGAGDELFQSLSAHPQAAVSFPTTIAASDNPHRAIRVYILPAAQAAGHRIPWETLKTQTGFLSRELRVPVVRIANDLKRRDDGIITNKNLKIVVVLGALGIDCGVEWDELYAALAAWPHSFEVSVATYDTGLKKRIDVLPECHVGGLKLASGAIRSIKCDMMLDRSATLMQYINQKSPHICHFFCHGTSDANGQLEIAHRGTALANDQPIFLSKDDVSGVANSAWLITLNACKSAAAGAAAAPPVALPGPQPGGNTAISAASFAAALVGQGVPFVVGMRERIASNIVPKFTRAFYVNALTILAGCVGAGGKTRLDLCPAILAGQDAICGHFGNPALATREQPDWTFPVFYTREEMFSIVSVDGDSIAADYQIAVTAKAELRTLENLLAKGVAPSISGEIETRIVALKHELGLEKV